MDLCFQKAVNKNCNVQPKYSPFKEAHNSRCNEKVAYSLFKEAPNSNFTTREMPGDATLLSLNLYVLPALSSQLSMFSTLCMMYSPVHFLLCQSCRNLRNNPL